MGRRLGILVGPTLEAPEGHRQGGHLQSHSPNHHCGEKT